MQRRALLGGIFVSASLLVVGSGVLGACETARDGTSGSVYVASPSAVSNASASSATSTGGSGGNGGQGGASTIASGGSGGATLSCGTVETIADPTTKSGDTTMSINHADGSCELGGARDDVYQFTAANAGVLDIELMASADLGLHVRKVCDDPSSEAGCKDTTGGDESLVLTVNQGDVFFVFVDGFTDQDFGPYTLTIGTRATVCGDSMVDPGEQCDPPSPGTCSDQCEFVTEVGNCADGLDNDGDGKIDCEDEDCQGDASCDLTTECAGAITLLASQGGNTTSGGHQFRGSCTGEGANETIYSYLSPTAGVLSVTVQATPNLGIYQRDTCNDATSEVFCADSQPAAMSEGYEAPIPANVTETFFIDGSTAADKGAFNFLTTFTAATEIEPNDDASTAESVSNVIASGTPKIGMIYPRGDVDFYEVTTTAAGQHIVATTSDLGSGACAKGSLNTYLAIFDDSMGMLGEDEDINTTNHCSTLSITAPDPGNYFVQVRGGIGVENAFGYKLTVTVQ